MKSKTKERLQQDKTRICKQIGILPCEEPRLVLDRKEMRSLITGKTQNSKRIAGLGECHPEIRTIFVDASYRLTQRTFSDGKPMYHGQYDLETERYKWCPAKRRTTYKDFLQTLVHELVHYRFAYLGHSKKYEQRIKEILRGRTFEPKHVHLFALYPKQYRHGIDDNPIIE
jgi:hypothetical protein